MFKISVDTCLMPLHYLFNLCIFIMITGNFLAVGSMESQIEKFGSLML